MTIQNELAWEAFRYISGELNDAELSAFEARLATDQAAREAVADAVELADATCAALAEPAVAVRSVGNQPSRIWYGIAVGVAACLAVMFAVHQFDHSHEQVAGPLEASPGDNALAVRWSEFRERQEDFQVWDELDSDLTTDDESFSDEEDATASTDAPAWMLAAVEQSRKTAGMLDDGPLDQ